MTVSLENLFLKSISFFPSYITLFPKQLDSIAKMLRTSKEM